MIPEGCRGMVLVVEDDFGIRESISEVLEDHQYLPVPAVNGKDALERLKASTDKPCVILLDIMMPVMDGWDFRAVQREDPELSSIPVVVLTAHANLREADARLKASAYLSKPVTMEALLSTVDRFCAS